MAHVFQTFKGTKPHPRWRFRYTDWQGQRRSATGTTSRAETEKLALHVQSNQDAIRKGWRPPPKTSDKPREFSDVAAEYLAWGNSQGGRGGRPWGKTHARMRTAFLEWWRERLGLEMLADLVGLLPRVEKALRALETQGRSGKTLQNYSDGLAAFCDWCVSRGYLESDPLSGLAPFDTTPKTRRRAMTREEIQKLFEHCAPKRRRCYEVAFASGLRAGELTALRIHHLDRDRGGVQLDAAWTKNRKHGFQPLPSWLMQKLADASKGKDPDEALLYVPSHPARDLDEDLKAAGVPKWTPRGKLDFHACRVAYVSFVLEAGASVKEAQELARHATASLTLDTYGRARLERLAAVTESIGEHLAHPRESPTRAQQRMAVGANQTPERACVVEAAGIEPASLVLEKQFARVSATLPNSRSVPILTAGRPIRSPLAR